MRFTLAMSTVVLAVLTVAMPQPAKKAGTMAIPITKRSTLVNADNTVNADALKSHVAALRAKILRGFENFEKNTGAGHPASMKLIGKREAGIALTNYKNRLWYGSISVGTPASPFTVVFDTGSGDLVIPGSNCTSSCNGHTLWDPSSSSTSQDLNQTFSNKYEDGSTLSGELYTDIVSIAGYSANNQTFGAATSYSAGFQSSRFPSDGLMGMGFQSISTYDASPVFQSLVSQGQLGTSVFSFKLSSLGGELYIGGSNPALYTGSFTYAPVTQQGYWQVNMDNIQGDGQTLLSKVDCIIDTGASVIAGIPSQVQMMYDAIGGIASMSNGVSYYTFPCDNFPTIGLTFGGTTFNISQSALNLGPTPSNTSNCISGIVPMDTSIGLWIVGDVFLQSVYTAFDVGDTRVGFAQLA